MMGDRIVLGVATLIPSDDYPIQSLVSSIVLVVMRKSMFKFLIRFLMVVVAVFARPSQSFANTSTGQSREPEMQTAGTIKDYGKESH